MKLLMVLLFAFFSVSSFANDRLICNYLKAKKLSSFIKNRDDINDKKFKKLADTVSKEMDQKRAEACSKGQSPVLAVNFDTCSTSCNFHGLSEMRSAAMMMSGGIIKSNAETKKCLDLCFKYQEVTFAFKDGIRAKAESSPDCDASVADGERGNSKSNLIDTVIRSRNNGSGSRQ